jgi:hypothetical protein
LSSFRILSMSDISATVANELSRYYQEIADRITELVEPLTDDQLWTRPYPHGNSVGHLLLHLTGNLSYYVGTEIAHTGYVRNRPLEFSDPSRQPKAAVLRGFHQAIAMVRASLAQQQPDDWSAAYTAKAWKTAAPGSTPS